MKLLCLLFALGVLELAAGKPSSCTILGGFCQISLKRKCVYGNPLPANCGINAECCPRKPDECEKRGGFCMNPLYARCPSWVYIPVNCGPNEKCCKIK